MRVLKVALMALVAMFALAGGLILTAIVATATVLLLAGRRLLGRGRVWGPPPQSRAQPTLRKEDDVIDVSATELPDRTSDPR